jgi:hypothetical protein
MAASIGIRIYRRANLQNGRSQLPGWRVAGEAGKFIHFAAGVGINEAISIRFSLPAVNAAVFRNFQSSREEGGRKPPQSSLA